MSSLARKRAEKTRTKKPFNKQKIQFQINFKFFRRTRQRKNNIQAKQPSVNIEVFTSKRSKKMIN